MDGVAERERNPVNKHQIQPECKIRAADVELGGLTCLVGPNSEAWKSPLFQFH